MKKEKIQDKLIKQPYYEGGDKALKDFISQHLLYPPDSQKNGIAGDVHLRYEIDYKGVVTDVKIIGGLDQLCNEEAIRVVKSLRFIVPKTPRHLKVTFHKTITIHFRVNEPIKIVTEEIPSPASHQPAIAYSYIIKPAAINKEIKKTETYHYNIKI